MTLQRCAVQNWSSRVPFSFLVHLDTVDLFERLLGSVIGLRGLEHRPSVAISHQNVRAVP